MEDMTEYFEFLDSLRESGEFNMFGVRPLLAVTFDLDRKTSFRVLAEWQRTFDKDKTAAERAALVTA